MKFASVLTGLLVACGLLLARSSRAALSFDLNYGFSGTPPASGSQPWANVSIQSDGGGGVYLQLTTPHLTTGSSAFENIDALYLNFNSSLNVNQLSFSRVFPTDNSIVTSSIQTGANGFKADGDGFYDINLTFPTGQGAGTFGPNDRLLYNIRYTGGTLLVSDFAFVGAPGGGTGEYYAGAHVQNTANGSGSAWIGATGYSQVPDFVVVPESRPIPCLMIALGLALAVFTKKSSSFPKLKLP